LTMIYLTERSRVIDKVEILKKRFAKLDKHYFNTIEFAQRHIGATIR